LKYQEIARQTFGAHDEAVQQTLRGPAPAAV
jgi:hypothetical protein